MGRDSKQKHGTSQSKNKPAEVNNVHGRFESLFGFKTSDLTSWDSFLKLMCRPTDPSSLGWLRAMFGVLMLLDIWQERGWGELVELFGDEEECRFPLFDFLKPLPLEWMYVVYLLMCIGEIGLVLGLFYRMSCLLYVVCYWYLFLLDKTRWNNHSYLFGLFGLMFLITDANRYWSLDGLLFKKKRNAHIPLWNYTLFRFQVCLTCYSVIGQGFPPSKQALF